MSQVFCISTSTIMGLAIAVLTTTASGDVAAAETSQPNILFCLADNHSWLHVGAMGNRAIKTPAFDRVAREGALFTHAFACAASCTPSRSGILTGQDIWRLEQGANLYGTLPAKFTVYPDLLEQAGYHIGYAGKGWEPGRLEPGGRTRNPAGPKYADFKSFLDARSPGKPFYFWMGILRRPSADVELAEKDRLKRVEVPPFLPGNDVVRRHFVEYFAKIETYDQMVQSILDLLDETGELDNTLIVYTCDNGMDFPRCYPNLYDTGTHEYLAIRWANKVKPGRTVDDFVNLIDLAPTFLEAAGVDVPPSMTGRSLLPVLLSDKSGRVDPDRDHVITARERHDWCRENGVGYPSRAIRTYDYLYIRNYEPDRWPAGSPVLSNESEGLYSDCDRSTTKDYMMAHHSDPDVRPLYRLAFAKRPAEELYDLGRDPHQMKNVASDASYHVIKSQLASRLEEHLKLGGDPRALGRKAPWDAYPYYGRTKLTFDPDAFVPQ